MTAARASINSPATALFMSVFTSQAAVLVLAPVLVDVARDLDVSTATAGQLRIVAAPVAAVVAILVARFAGRVALHSLLGFGTALVAAGSVASAAAPSFVLLGLAQVPLWIGISVLTAAGVGAAGSWTAPEVRSRVVARALAGAPAAWIVGMPVIGLVAETSWRLTFLVVPLPAALLTGALLITARSHRAQRHPGASLLELLRAPGARGWAFAELLSMSSWAGTLVFSGALFVEAYGTSAGVTGLLLGTVALAYLVGNALGGRIHGNCRLRRALARGNVAAAAAVALMWVFTPNLFVTLLLFGFAAIAVAARSVAATAYGFVIGGDRGLEVGAARAVLGHAGYLGGSLLGGVALAIGGHAAVGLAFGALLVAGTAPYFSAWRARCSIER